MADVELTATALSKTYRMVGRDRVVALLLCIQDVYPNQEMELWSKGRSTNEFHLRLLDENYTLVFVDNGDEFTVITQMHDHPEYHDNEVYEVVERDEWEEKFAGRLDESQELGSDEHTCKEVTGQ